MSAAGKVCVVTGATSGIGLETVRGLARDGTHVVMVARNAEKGEARRREIEAATGARVDLLLADLSRLADVESLAERIDASYPRIDALVNNAGHYRLKRELTPDGLESTIAVNHVAPFLLTNLLLDRLRASAPSRIVAVASGAHRFARLDVDDLNLERGWGSWRAYCNSKLANIMFTYALARRLEGSEVTANCLHPGFVVSNFGSGNRVPVRPFMMVARPFGHSPRVAARIPLRLIADPGLEAVSGRYFEARREARSSKVSYDIDLQERLWAASAQLAGVDV